uniref:Uncharacterized protein n=1 Tax=Romanomermis culicivorax TaxID=13658 RepID=A0A915L461_ROMCU
MLSDTKEKCTRLNSCQARKRILLDNGGSLPTFVQYLITNVSIVYIVRNAFLLYKATYTVISFLTGLDVMSLSYELCVFEQIATVVVYGIVYKKNRQILNNFVVTAVKNNLNERFVQWANVKVTKWLIPLTLISVTLNVSSVALTTSLRTFMTMTFFDATTLALSMIAVFSFEAQIFPLLCIRFSSTLMQGIQQQHPKVYKLFSLVEKSSYRDNFVNSFRHKNKSPETGITSTDVAHGAKKIENGILKRVGKLSDGKKKIVDHRLNPDAQAAILMEMWDMNAN